MGRKASIPGPGSVDRKRNQRNNGDLSTSHKFSMNLDWQQSEDCVAVSCAGRNCALVCPSFKRNLQTTGPLWTQIRSPSARGCTFCEVLLQMKSKATWRRWLILGNILLQSSQLPVSADRTSVTLIRSMSDSPALAFCNTLSTVNILFQNYIDDEISSILSASMNFMMWWMAETIIGFLVTQSGASM